MFNSMDLFSHSLIGRQPFLMDKFYGAFAMVSSMSFFMLS